MANGLPLEPAQDFEQRGPTDQKTDQGRDQEHSKKKQIDNVQRIKHLPVTDQKGLETGDMGERPGEGKGGQGEDKDEQRILREEQVAETSVEILFQPLECRAVLPVERGKSDGLAAGFPEMHATQIGQ